MRLLLCNCSASLPPPPSSLSPPKPPPILLFTTTTTTTTTTNSLNWPHKTLIGALTGALSFSLLFSSPSSVALDSSLLTQSQPPPSSADYCRQEDQTEDRYETAPGLLTNERIVDEAWEIRKKEDILATSIQTRSKAHDIIRRMLASLGDPYTRFLSPSEFSKMARYDMTGIGINLREVPDEDGAVKLKVLGLILDGPAHTAGVRQPLISTKRKGLEEGYSKGETGFILDGIPHTRIQAEILDRIADIDLVVNFKGSEECLLKHVRNGIYSTGQEFMSMGSFSADVQGAWKEKLCIYAEQSNASST
ncbi:hypothetical protein TEA_001702 [Camellia sinensis var. sinensis]|uniref:Uncharacterized protein n=1 Tax=Camellia sinensis var. sinensis TaxID=542762 RepID=A0A4S4D3Z4_CAMSN|nr:hypothetical protein TEA_001702 [Camellia sinensis var. sinensis]